MHAAGYKHKEIAEGCSEYKRPEEQPGSCWQDFFPDPVPKNITPSRNFIQPQLWYFQQFRGRCPMEKYSATLGLQPKKSVEFLGAEFVGGLAKG